MSPNNKLFDLQQLTGGDLVLGMTLAEIFLLLMLIVWWAFGLEAEARAKAASVDDADLPRQVKLLNERVERLDKENAELQRRIEHLRKMVGAGGSSDEELEKAYQDRLAEAKRGHRKCRHENILVEATVADGVETIRLLQDIRVPPGTELVVGRQLGGAEIDVFLSSIRRFYGSEKPECRFDYRLVYSTDTDYRYAGERYEQYFYVAQRRRTR